MQKIYTNISLLCDLLLVLIKTRDLGEFRDTGIIYKYFFEYITTEISIIVVVTNRYRVMVLPYNIGDELLHC